MKPAGSRIAYIDGLRALAVLSVLIYHSAKATPAARWFVEGRHGVDLFFVLSGFCLSYPVLRKLAEGGAAVFDTPLFFAKRILRIVPPYYAAIAVFAGLAVALEFAHRPLPEMMSATAPLDVLKQFFFLDYNLNFSNGSFWTLAVEARWYIFFPLILWLWVNARKSFWLLMASAAFAYNFTRLGGSELGFGIDFATLPAFMAGIVAAHALISQDSRAKLAWYALPVMLIVTQLMHGRYHVLQDTLDWQLIAFCMVVCVGREPWLQRLFAWKPATFIGIASYSIYLYHEPIAGILETDFGFGMVAATLVSLIVGIAAWYAIERYTQLPAFRAQPLNGAYRLLIKVFALLEIPSKTLYVRANSGPTVLPVPASEPGLTA